MKLHILCLLLIVLCIFVCPANANQRPVVPNPQPQEFTLAQAFEQLTVYQQGQNRQVVRFIERSVYTMSSDAQKSQVIRKHLLELLLNPKSTLSARQLTCQWLPLVADPKAISICKSMLDDKETFAMALYALEQIDSDKTAAILVNSLDRFKPDQRIAIINAIDRRGIFSARHKLINLLDDPDPQTASAAATSLGLLGSSPVAQALMTAKNMPPGVRRNALLRCAQKAHRTGDIKTARMIYLFLWAQHDIAILAPLVKIDPISGKEVLLKAVQMDDPLISRTAINLAATLPDSQVHSALIKQMQKANPQTKLTLIRALSDNNVKAALPVISSQITSKDHEIAAASIQATGLMGNGNNIASLAICAAGQAAPLAKLARETLVQLHGEDINPMILQLIQTGSPYLRAELINAAIRRRIIIPVDKLWSIADGKEQPIEARRAAITALEQFKDKANYSRMINFWSQLDQMALANTIKQSVRRMGQELLPVDRDIPLLVSLRASTPTAIQAQILVLLCQFGGEQSLPAVRNALNQNDPELKTAAVRALVLSPQKAAGDELVVIARTSTSSKDRILAQRGLLTRAADTRFSTQARLAMLDGLLESYPEKAIKDRAVELRNPLYGSSPKYRWETLEKSITPGYRLAAYMNCGIETSTENTDGPSLKSLSGKPYHWNDLGKHAHHAAGSILFDPSRLSFIAKNLKPDRQYKLGICWWDYDNNGRKQSVEIDGKVLLENALLPAYTAKKQPPAEFKIDIPQEMVADGQCLIQIDRKANANCVVSEIWLVESLDQVKPAIAKSRQVDPNAKRILIITGEDFNGHQWQQTAPTLKALLEKDPRLAVDVLYDLKQLSEYDLSPYAAAVLHFKNYDKNIPGHKALQKLINFVEDGHGLTLVHFACGAFQEHKQEFSELAGRTWNPKLRGHDPYGKFTVNITETHHPVTQGLTDFVTEDELYTCLDGDFNIQVLAQSISTVDKKIYPLAFTLHYGKGRVYHNVLGHNVKAFQPPGVGELFRRGVAWTAYLTPVQ